MAVVRAVADAGESGLRLSDVAVSLDLHKASAARLLNCLVGEAVLERRSDRRYRVHEGFRGLLGAPASSVRLREIARPALSQISDVLGEVAFLSVRSGYDSLCLDRQVGWYAIQALSLDVGSRRPLGIGAGSLALLAWLPDSEIELALRATQARRAAFLEYDEANLRALLAEARELGVTEVRDLVVSGMTGIGIPCFDGDGQPVAALSVAALSKRLAGERRQLAIATLQECRGRVEAGLQAAVGRDGEEADLPENTPSTETTVVGGTYHG